MRCRLIASIQAVFKYTAILSCVLASLFFIPAHAACPDYTKFDVIEADASTLPESWFVYGLDDRTGLYKAVIGGGPSQRFAGTESGFIRSVEISDDGQWIVFSNINTFKCYLIKSDGSLLTEVPLPHGTVDGQDYAPLNIGFYRKSPYGDELTYVADDKHIRAIAVTFSQSGVTFGADRVIVDLTDNPRAVIETMESMRYPVCGNKVYGRFNLINPECGRNGFLSIPDSGRGTGRYSDLFQWVDDREGYWWGCGHAMSHDGSLCASNSSMLGPNECVPNHETNNDHKGFYITPFFDSNHQPIRYSEQAVPYGTSINWAPERFRWGTWYEISFDQWQFSNDRRYMIGAQFGDASPLKCLWVVAWESNTWYRVTPEQNTAIPRYCALFLPGSREQTCPDPGFGITAPAGGETFMVGHDIEILMTACRPVDVGIKIFIGEKNFPVPGYSNSINLPGVPTVTFTIPEVFYENVWDPEQQKAVPTPVSPLSDNCRIRVFNYNDFAIYEETESFTIVPNPDALVKPRGRDIRAGRHAPRLILPGMPGSRVITVPPGMRVAVVFDAAGREVWRFGHSSSTIHEEQILLPDLVAGRSTVLFLRYLR